MTDGGKTFRWPIRVYIEDTDAGGIVFYANYLKYMERARTEWVRQNGAALRARLENGISFVVQKVQLEYHRPAKLDDELWVSARVVNHGKAFMEFEQAVFRDLDEGGPLVEARIKVVCVDLERNRPRRLPDDIFQLVSSQTQS
ncbi:tol-pal system-associated acyl-CoA thioesterase [Marinobacteraceae bacterium S3BR75-40.1]